jgi:hypothetical protein
MKIRNGFVSNSSSSSFMIMGIVRKSFQLPKDLMDEIEKDDIIDFIFDDSGPIYIGKVLMYSHEEAGVDIEPAVDISVSEIYQYLIKYFPDVKSEDIKFISGVMYG